jgi:hypothetical protein
MLCAPGTGFSLSQSAGPTHIRVGSYSETCSKEVSALWRLAYISSGSQPTPQPVLWTLDQLLLQLLLTTLTTPPLQQLLLTCWEDVQHLLNADYS